MMLLFNVGAAALLLPPALGHGGRRHSRPLALVGEYLWSTCRSTASTRPLAELLMFAVSYLAVATLTNQLGRQMRASEALADQRGAEAANLAEVNELIIRRMRTGVLLVDGDGRIRLANEAALLLLGDARRRPAQPARGAVARTGAPPAALAQRRQHDETPMQPSAPSSPKCCRASPACCADSDTVADLPRRHLAAVAPRRIADAGRAGPLLRQPRPRDPQSARRDQLRRAAAGGIQGHHDGDRRLLEIIHQQCMRTNGIVESVLGLARRERAKPEHVDLVGFVRQFVEEYQQTMPIESDILRDRRRSAARCRRWSTRATCSRS